MGEGNGGWSHSLWINSAPGPMVSPQGWRRSPPTLLVMMLLPPVIIVKIILIDNSIYCYCYALTVYQALCQA